MPRVVTGVIRERVARAFAGAIVALRFLVVLAWIAAAVLVVGSILVIAMLIVPAATARSTGKNSGPE